MAPPFLVPARGTADPRGPWWRALVVLGIVVVAVTSGPFLVLGLVGVRQGAGQALLCLGLVLLVSALGGVARELAERAHHRSPPQPSSVTWDGEAALHLPRSSGRSLVSSGVLTGFAAVSGLGAAFAVSGGRVPGAVVLLVVAGLLLAVAAPWSAGGGGLWLTPTRVAHELDGTRWQVGWDDVTGCSGEDPVSLGLRQGARPVVRRTPAVGRSRVRASRGDQLLVDARYLAGGPALATQVVRRGVADRAFRASLGSPGS